MTRSASVLLLALLALGCESAAPLESRLRSCELVGEGHLPALPLYAPDECYERCLAAASCEQLESALCRTEVSLLAACDAECAFACEGGALLAVESVCDGREDCEGGEDERGCATYLCDDGQELVGEHRCDGLRSCRDGSDEEGCEQVGFECDDGERVFAGARCDGWAACTDRSDEAGCADRLWRCEG